MKEDTIYDCVENFEDYFECIDDEQLKEWYTKKELSYIWFCDLFATFYDNDLELKYGKLLYETIKSIIDRTQIDLINEKYEEYLLCLNLIGVDKLDWGSSIRFCWFDDKGIENKYKGYLKQIDSVKGD